MNRFLLIRLYIEEQESAAACAEKFSAECTGLDSFRVESVYGIRGDRAGNSTFQFPGIVEKTAKLVEVRL